MKALLQIALFLWAGVVVAQPLLPLKKVVDAYCLDCHGGDAIKGDLNLETLLSRDIASEVESWEKVVRQLRARHMPPIGKKRPDETGYKTAATALEFQLDHVWESQPNPGRTETIRRLTRTEYRHAVRDLLGLEIDVAKLLPRDESSHGFDNVTVGELSPNLLNRYITAAQKISRLAVGRPLKAPDIHIYRLRPDVTQEERIESMPLGTRGGLLQRHTFPRDGEYEIRINLARDRNEHVEGLHGRHQVEILVDRKRVKTLVVKPPPNRNDHTQVDAHLKVRIPVKAGPHDLGVTFVKNASSLEETLRQPYAAHFNMHRHPRLSPAVFQVSITGPYADNGIGETPSRRRIFTAESGEVGAPEKILGKLMRLAYRRPVHKTDLERPMAFFRQGEAEGGFEAGIESALSAILVSRGFLFRVERDPDGLASGTPYVISDLELASRLSFFLWSSLPDDELLSLAEKGKLHQPEVLTRQTRRMLADERAMSLVTHFADQWLYLRNLDSVSPNARLFPDFDDNLRQAFRRETEMHFERMLREDRSVLDLLVSRDTFLNERLARHYGIPHIFGSRFRRVELEAGSRRGGLLRQAGLLAVTSYATRTSPVIRGHWILQNLLGTPPPPPPADVPALEENTVAADLPMRERLAAHRENPSCARCHNLMDPVGFALEQFDAIGGWRTMESGRPVDVSGGLPDGSVFHGVDGLEKALLQRPDLFVRTLSEKLLTFALGRGVTHHDAPAIRGVVRASASDDYRFSSIIVSIVKSKPFTMRMKD